MTAILRGCRSTAARLQSLGTPAATVALLRDSPLGVECLLLRKSRTMRFGGLWVFAGGKVEVADQVHHSDDGSIDVLSTAANAASREATEETGLAVSPSRLVFISHWVPPPAEVAVRGTGFSTFFFVAAHEGDAVHVDGTEIDTSLWLRPAEALQRHASGELGLLPPTWMTLEVLESIGAQRGGTSTSTVEHTLAVLRDTPPLEYATRSAVVGPQEAVVFMWEGDAGWAASDPAVPGPRLRLVSSVDGAPGHGSSSSKDVHVGELACGAATLKLERSPSRPKSRL